MPLESIQYGLTLDECGTADLFDSLAEALNYRIDDRQRVLRVEYHDVTDEVT
jgi:hypothetical protein